MSQFEKEQHNTNTRAIAIMLGEIEPKNRLEKQISLAFEYYKLINNIEENDDLDLNSEEFQNEIMLLWAKDGNGSLSKYYRDIEDHADFSSHSRLMGNFLNITLQDVIFYRENKVLPEN